MERICVDCKSYRNENIPITVGCGECRRFPPTAIARQCDSTYAMGKYPIVSEYNPACDEFKEKPTTQSQ